MSTRALSRAERARAATFALLAAVILLGPIYGHFLATGKHQHLGWRMYRVRAVDFCAVDYRLHRADGSEERVDRFATLGYGEEQPPPFELWRIGSPEVAYDWARQLCARLGRGADLRARIRCASADGWHEVDAGDKRLCP